MTNEKKSLQNFFDVLSQMINLWKKEITKKEIQPHKELSIISETEELLYRLSELTPRDEIHREIIQLAIPLLKWIISDIKILRLLKAIVTAIYEENIPPQLSQEEKKKILNIISILTKEKPKESEVMTFKLDEDKIPINRQKERMYTLILLRTSIPKFLATDGHIYRNLTKNTIANLPTNDVEALKRKLKDLVEILR